MKHTKAQYKKWAEREAKKLAKLTKAGARSSTLRVVEATLKEYEKLAE